MHMVIGVARREHAAVPARVETDDFHRLAGDRKANFGLFVRLGTVFSLALIAQDVERCLRNMAVDQEGKGLVDVNAALHGEGQKLFFKLMFAVNRSTERYAAPVLDDGVNEESGTVG